MKSVMQATAALRAARELRGTFRGGLVLPSETAARSAVAQNWLISVMSGLLPGAHTERLSGPAHLSGRRDRWSEGSGT